MAIRRRGPKGGLVTTRIPLTSINSVSTQAANKRQPNEADALDNVMISLERGIEKRPGFEILPQHTMASLTGWDFTSNTTKYNLFSLPNGNDLFYYWYSINEDNTFLIVIDYDATGDADKLFYVYQILTNGTWKELTPQTQWDTNIAAGNATVTAYATANGLTYAQAAALGIVSSVSRSYITYGTGTTNAKDSLKIVSLGANMVILNTNVSAGFSSDIGGKLFNLNGTVSSIDDIDGRKITYYTAAKVAKVYDEGDDGTAATGDDVLLGWKPAIETGVSTSNASSGSHIHLGSGSSTVNDTYSWYKVTITQGPGTGESKWIKDYDGSSKKADVYGTNWTVTPTTASYFSIDLSIQNVQGTATTGSNNTITLDSFASSVDDIYNGETIVITGGTGSGQSRTILDYNGSTKVVTVSSNWTTNPNSTSVYSIEIKKADYISADDYFYYKSDSAFLGQRVDDISAIKLPPENDDWYANNSKLTTTTDTTARQMLRSLYDPDTSFNGIIDGRGKIFYALNPYLNTTSGYYRVISWNPTEQTFYYSPTDVNKGIYKLSGTTGSVTHTTAITSSGRPYLQKVRTPDEHSYIDPRRMPQKLKVTVVDGSAINGNTVRMSLEPIKWTPRTSGTKTTNPGPSIFKTVDRKELKQVRIKSIAVFKDRLWFAADDVVFSSQNGEYETLFLDDPSNIVTTDPIDIRLSSNNYAEITNMVPFEEYLFIDTKANTQFQLTAASNAELSPTNVNVSPITYYATASITNPQLIGSRLFFFAPERLYLFIGKNQLGYSSAVEVSANAAGYLPTNYKDVCTAPAQDTIVMVDADNLSDLYLYTNRFSGERVIQNSFYRYQMDSSEDSIQSIQTIKNYLYAVTYISNIGYVIKRTKLISESVMVPRMDNMLYLKLFTSGANPNVYYDSATNTTVFTVPDISFNSSMTHIVLDETWTSPSNESLALTILAPYSKKAVNNGAIELYFTGNYVPTSGTKYIYVGKMFEANVTLSTLFVRDENNNIVDGVLNVRTGVFRHYNTGNYDVEVSHHGRTPLVSKFNAQKPDLPQNEDTLPLEIIENQGEFVAKVFGHSDFTTISIKSDYCTPMNITNIEFKGKFKQKYSSLN